MANVLENARRAAAKRSVLCVHDARRFGQHRREVLSAISGYASSERKVQAGRDLYSVGERCNAVYIVISGWAAVYDLLRDGRRQILQFALPGSWLRFNPDSVEVAVYSAVALTDVTVSTLSHSALLALSKDCPEFGMRLARMVARDRILSFDHLTSIGRRSARERVARLLLELFIRCRSQLPGHLIEEMQLPLTQEHIADATGLTIVHVNRVLSELRDEGIVQFQYRKLVMLDSDRLVAVAAIDPRLASALMHRDAFGEAGPAIGGA